MEFHQLKLSHLPMRLRRLLASSLLAYLLVGVASKEYIWVHHGVRKPPSTTPATDSARHRHRYVAPFRVRSVLTRSGRWLRNFAGWITPRLSPLIPSTPSRVCWDRERGMLFCALLVSCTMSSRRSSTIPSMSSFTPQSGKTQRGLPVAHSLCSMVSSNPCVLDPPFPVAATHASLSRSPTVLIVMPPISVRCHSLAKSCVRQCAFVISDSTSVQRPCPSSWIPFVAQTSSSSPPAPSSPFLLEQVIVVGPFPPSRACDRQGRRSSRR